MSKVNSKDAAKVAHTKFLKSMGCLPEQLKARKPKGKVKLQLNYAGVADSYFDKKPLVEALQGPVDGGQKRDIITNIYKLSQADQEKVKTLASQVSTGYHKGGLQLITAGTDMKTIGKK